MNKTYENLKRNVLWALNSYNTLSYKNRMIYAAFKRYENTTPRKEKITYKKAMNPKHVFIKELLNLGLVPRQVASLKQKHIDFEKNIIRIDNKTFTISESIKETLKQYIKEGHRYVFWSNRNKKYSTRSIQQIKTFRLKPDVSTAVHKSENTTYKRNKPS